MKRIIVGVVSAVLCSIGLVGVVGAETALPSTNEANELSGGPYVEVVSTGPGTITLEFVNPTDWIYSFEYRIDGQEATTGTPHPVVAGDVIYPTQVCMDGRPGGTSCPTEDSQLRTISAAEFVEVRLALGAESDYFFDWTRFDVGAPAGPETTDDCRNGGWREYGFSNQGQCISAVNRGGGPPRGRS